MNSHIETACFHDAGNRELIYASNKEADWIHNTTDIRSCYGQIINKDSGSSILLISLDSTGVVLNVVKLIPNCLGDNITAYLHVPYGLNVSGAILQSAIYDVISALEKNGRDAVSLCLESISEKEFELVPNINLSPKERPELAYRNVSSDNNSSNSLCSVLDSLFQEYYSHYKYIFLAIDGQFIANKDSYTDLTSLEIKDWRNVRKDNSTSDSSRERELELGHEIISSSSLSNDDKREDVPLIEYSSEWLKNNTNIKGWLIFFLFAIIVGGPASFIYSIASFKLEDYGGSYYLGSVDILIGVFLLLIAIYTFYGFVSRKPNAVFWGKIYVILIFVTNILSLIGVEDNVRNDKFVIRGIVWAIIWFLYLTFSKQVKTIIPPTYRKIAKSDKGILLSGVLILVFLTVFGFLQVYSIANNRIKDEAILKNSILATNQRTDGRVIFTIPEGFMCESKNIEVEGTSLTLFTIEKEDEGSCTMCSDYDTDKSTNNFDVYWEGLKDQEASGYRSVQIGRGSMWINSNECLYRITKYDVDGVFVYWRFYLLFDNETGKVCVASFYDLNNSTSYVFELLESVKFK